MRWSDLLPDPAIVEALAYAGERPEDGDQNAKRRWSEKFAHACAVAFARELRNCVELRGKSITPAAIGDGTEALVPLGAGTNKRVDVTVVDRILGLEIGLSLKGLNFRDSGGNQFDKNLTGRMYELADEVRLVHEWLPRAFMAAVFFLPLESAADKTPRAASSFARTATNLRERSGRIDPSLAGQAGRCDSAYVALYSTGAGSPGYPPGLVRLIDVRTPPPRRGRPRIADTLSIREAVEQIVARATFSAEAEWGEPELDPTEPGSARK